MALQTPEEKLKQLCGGVVRDIDQECENIARCCYLCKKVHKCKVAITKEQFCFIHTGSRTMTNNEWVKLRELYWKEAL